MAAKKTSGKRRHVTGRGRPRRFVVTFRQEPYGPFERLGTVTLPDRGDELDVEHALSRIGLYTPRGNDVLRWGNHGATIQDVHGGTTRLAKVGTGEPKHTVRKIRRRKRS
jgi:hypothetical protein